MQYLSGKICFLPVVRKKIMTEKRSDYRKRQQKDHRNIFDKVKKAFSEDQEEKVDHNSDLENTSFEQEEPVRRSLDGDGEPDLFTEDVEEDVRKEASEEKGLKLKKRLNRAILILIVLIILVLLALFHL